MPLRQAAHSSDHGLNDLGQHVPSALGTQSSRFDARHVKQVSDQHVEVIGLVVDGGQQFRSRR